MLLVALMTGVLAAVVFSRPADPHDGASPPASAPTTSAPIPPTSEEAFCAAFRRLAATQGEYAAMPDERAGELLREAVDDLVAGGVPATMTLPARGGYHTVVEGIYASLGLSLERSAVGAPDEPVAGEDAAFASYLAQFCPA